MDKAPLATHPIVTALEAFARDDDSLRVWTEHLEYLSLSDGGVLFHQGEPADSMFFIESGEVAVVLEVAGALTLSGCLPRGGMKCAAVAILAADPIAAAAPAPRAAAAAAAMQQVHHRRCRCC